MVDLPDSPDPGSQRLRKVRLGNWKLAEMLIASRSPENQVLGTL